MVYLFQLLFKLLLIINYDEFLAIPIHSYGGLAFLTIPIHGYGGLHQPHSGGRGGRVAIGFQESFNFQIPGTNYTAIDYISHGVEDYR